MRLITSRAQVRFSRPPPVGFRLIVRNHIRRATFKLCAASPHTRHKDGAQTTVLWWFDDAGQLFTSGLAGNLNRAYQATNAPRAVWIKLAAIEEARRTLLRTFPQLSDSAVDYLATVW